MIFLDKVWTVRWKEKDF